MLDRYNFFNDYFDENDKMNKKGFMKFDLGNYLRSGSPTSFRITNQFEYRPDKIAFKFYGDASLAWVLIYANNFPNGMADFWNNRIIIIPEMDVVTALTQA